MTDMLDDMMGDFPETTAPRAEMEGDTDEDVPGLGQCSPGSVTSPDIMSRDFSQSIQSEDCYNATTPEKEQDGDKRCEDDSALLIFDSLHLQDQQSCDKVSKENEKEGADHGFPVLVPVQIGSNVHDDTQHTQDDLNTAHMPYSITEHRQNQKISEDTFPIISHVFTDKTDENNLDSKEALASSYNTKDNETDQIHRSKVTIDLQPVSPVNNNMQVSTDEPAVVVGIGYRKTQVSKAWIYLSMLLRCMEFRHLVGHLGA
jgi:hypothetical protein